MAKRAGGRATPRSDRQHLRPQSRHSRMVRIVAIAALMFMLLSIVMVLLASTALACSCGATGSSDIEVVALATEIESGAGTTQQTWLIDILESRRGPFAESDIVSMTASVGPVDAGAGVQSSNSCGVGPSFPAGATLQVIGTETDEGILVNLCDAGSIALLDTLGNEIGSPSPSADSDDDGFPWSMVGLGVAVVAMYPAWRATGRMRAAT